MLEENGKEDECEDREEDLMGIVWEKMVKQKWWKKGLEKRRVLKRGNWVRERDNLLEWGFLGRGAFR